MRTIQYPAVISASMPCPWPLPMIWLKLHEDESEGKGREKEKERGKAGSGHGQHLENRGEPGLHALRMLIGQEEKRRYANACDRSRNRWPKLHPCNAHQEPEQEHTNRLPAGGRRVQQTAGASIMRSGSCVQQLRGTRDPHGRGAQPPHPGGDQQQLKAIQRKGGKGKEGIRRSA